MSPKKIVCVTKEGTAPHRHVTKVGVEMASHRWSVAQIRELIADGGVFVMRSPSKGELVKVAPFDCDCGASTLRSFIDSQMDPGLDEIEAYASCP